MKSTTEMDFGRINVGEIIGTRLIEPNELAEEDEVEMNKKELTKKLMNRMQNFGYFPSFTNVKTFIQEYEKLTNSEPRKPVVPQFVADWIEYCKFTHVDLQHALIVGDVYFYNYANQKDFSKLKEFLDTENNPELFARAWLDGYEVEEESKYTVKIKAVNQYLVKNPDEEFLGFLQSRLKSKFTRKELEEAGFGWVFDCEGIEVEEVEE